MFRPIHLAWRVEVAHGLLMRSRWLSKSLSEHPGLRVCLATHRVRDHPTQSSSELEHTQLGRPVRGSLYR